MTTPQMGPSALPGESTQPWLGKGDATSCGHPNPIWFTDSRLWNEVMGTSQDDEAPGIVCPSCFAGRADAHFDGSRWRILGWQLVPDWGRPYPEDADV